MLSDTLRTGPNLREVLILLHAALNFRAGTAPHCAPIHRAQQIPPPSTTSTDQQTQHGRLRHKGLNVYS